MQSTTPGQALARLRQICSRQEKCLSEAIVLLKRWGLSDEQASAVTDSLVKEKYIDESRYAAAFVRDRIGLDKWGMIKIRYQLYRKGIPDSIVQDALGSVDKHKYVAMIRKELEKKRKTLKDTGRELWARLTRYGSSRGYEEHIIRELLDELIEG
jgi:regulatory protein